MGGKSKRQRAWRRGYGAEAMAVWYLRLCGYRLLARRCKTPVGEIDLVVRRGRSLVFVEVKARPDLAGGLESLSPRQQGRIGRAAEYYLQRYGSAAAGYSPRLDMIVIRPWRWPYHIKNAWGI
jgi:putative endonuclease